MLRRILDWLRSADRTAAARVRPLIERLLAPVRAVNRRLWRHVGPWRWLTRASWLLVRRRGKKEPELPESTRPVLGRRFSRRAVRRDRGCRRARADTAQRPCRVRGALRDRAHPARRDRGTAVATGELAHGGARAAAVCIGVGLARRGGRLGDRQRGDPAPRRAPVAHEPVHRRAAGGDPLAAGLLGLAGTRARGRGDRARVHAAPSRRAPPRAARALVGAVAAAAGGVQATRSTVFWRAWPCIALLGAIGWTIVLTAAWTVAARFCVILVAALLMAAPGGVGGRARRRSDDELVCPARRLRWRSRCARGSCSRSRSSPCSSPRSSGPRSRSCAFRSPIARRRASRPMGSRCCSWSRGSSRLPR